MMKIISHKLVIVCQCINVNVDPLLACLGAWIVTLLAHISNILGLLMLAPCIFELKKMKIIKNEKT
jgi:hypothetical protein